MNAAATAMHALPAIGGRMLHPNELDLRRIVRLLEKRARYRYVSPVVEAFEEGYRIQSACCSRNIDASGGVIDIAWIVYDAECGAWNLYHKDHGRGSWQFYLAAGRLDAAMAHLNEDPARVFWQ